MDGLAEVEALDEAAIADLWALYRAEWWTASRTLEQTRRIVAGSSLVLGLLDAGTRRLAGFSRVLTDGVTKALILDVIVAPSHRGRGLGERQMQRILAHPALKDVAHFELYCRPELKPFYARWGFTSELGDLLFMRRAGLPSD